MIALIYNFDNNNIFDFMDKYFITKILFFSTYVQFNYVFQYKSDHGGTMRLKIIT